MKKIAVTAALILAGTFMANAETQARTQERVDSRIRAYQIMASTTRPLMMGSSTNSILGLQIKALNDEMEAKIRAIRDEYQAKIKALIAARGDENGTTTRPLSEDDNSRNGQTNGPEDNNGIFQMPRFRGDGSGINQTESRGPSVGGFMNILRGLFGGN